MAPIADVEAIVLRAPESDPSDLDSSSETVVVIVRDEEGREGIGEADAPAQVVQELVLMDDLHGWSRGLRGVLLGRDPFEIGALHRELYDATIYHGRRGLGVHALSAVDVALHDLVGKQLGRPVYQLLGGARREAIRPYATIYPGAAGDRTIGELMDDIARRFERALEIGFRAVKMEVLFGDVVTDRELVGCIAEGRRLLGDEIALLVDFGYRWSDWRSALWTLNRLEDCDLYLAEATLRHDDLDGHAKLAARVETRIGGAEMAATRYECGEWIERGGVDVLQPDVNRCGGLTEMVYIAALADMAGVLVVPHCWKTGITAAAARHFQAAAANVPYVEHLSPELFDSPLRRELVAPEPTLADGLIDLPTAPGLGVELDLDAVARYRVEV
ncbi:MAG TPA: mandelate racemase/muconate lactonizing enzyme family protein [Gaiellaceae bacterium]|nr:mandelate racemase/muconate lactonizing enzyme family protein [Gaiellaceae bacterium]